MTDPTTPTAPSLLDDYAFRVRPFDHQLAALRASVRKRAFALFMEPGTGKTKVTLDTAAILFKRGHVRGLLVVAPNDVHAQWVDEQMVEHLPTDIETRAVVWDASRASVMRRVDALMKPLPHTLHVLCMNHEALATKRGRVAARKFLKTYPSLFVLDESHAFKSPSAARTRAAIALAPLAFARRLLTGTETDGNPFDLYSQFQFLDPRIIGFDSFVAFKHRYGVWTRETAMTRPADPSKQPRRVEYESLQAYANLEELTARIAPFVFRARKRDCLDLPPKHYTRLPTHLSPAQRAVYESLLSEGLVLLDRASRGEPIAVRPVEGLDDKELLERVQDPRGRMTMKIKLTLQLRLQQCAGGFVTDDEGVTQCIEAAPDSIPRVVAACEHIERAMTVGEGKVIVWSVFRAELAMLQSVLKKRGHRVVRVDGTVTGQERVEAIAQFKSTSERAPRILVAHPRTMGTGQNLALANEMLYYSNPLSSILRTQSEDRIDRIGQTRTVTIADLVSRDAPIDRIILALHAKKSSMSARLASGKFDERVNIEELRKELELTC